MSVSGTTTYESPEVTFFSAQALNSITVTMSGGGGSGGGTSAWQQQVNQARQRGYFSSKTVGATKMEQTVSQGEISISSSATAYFVNSQTLEKENRWIYKFRFFAAAKTENAFQEDVDELGYARMNLEATSNIENQSYDISEEYLRIGSYPNDTAEGGEYVDLIIDIAATVVGVINGFFGLAWAAINLATAIGKMIHGKENDFENKSFYREWDYSMVSRAIQYWEVKIEVPPGQNVAFCFSYDIRSSSGEVLEGRKIRCSISAPVNLSETNNYKGVSFQII